MRDDPTSQGDMRPLWRSSGSIALTDAAAKTTIREPQPALAGAD
jgi:hypothetical protein